MLPLQDINKMNTVSDYVFMITALRRTPARSGVRLR